MLVTYELLELLPTDGGITALVDGRTGVTGGITTPEDNGGKTLLTDGLIGIIGVTGGIAIVFTLFPRRGLDIGGGMATVLTPPVLTNEGDTGGITGCLETGGGKTTLLLTNEGDTGGITGFTGCLETGGGKATLPLERDGDTGGMIVLLRGLDTGGGIATLPLERDGDAGGITGLETKGGLDIGGGRTGPFDLTNDIGGKATLLVGMRGRCMEG